MSSRTHFEVVGLEGQVLGLGLEASSPRKLPVLGSRTALFFEQLKFRWKMPKTLWKICKSLFCFGSIGVAKGGAWGPAPLAIAISPKTPIVSPVSVSF